MVLEILNTNNLEISVCETRFKNKIVIFSAIDNLVKECLVRPFKI